MHFFFQQHLIAIPSAFADPPVEIQIAFGW